jgi:hypothetical protein
LLFVCSVAVPASILADDYWELATIPTCRDDTFTTCNQLSPGVVQVHDLQGPSSAPDLDWMVVETKARRSYEVNVRGSNMFFAPDEVLCPSCSRVERVDAAGALLTAGTGVDGVHPLSATAVHVAVRWIGGAASQRDYIRVGGDTFNSFTANDRYEVIMRDTTLAVPRWNNASTQTTVLLISNQSPDAVTGSVFFYGPSGTLLHTEPLSIAVAGVQVMNTATFAPLAGLAGSATVAHTGGYGALAGKAVALEPGTGFTFDTAMSYVPY